MALVLDGSLAAASIRLQIAEEVKAYVAKGHRAPGLVAILVGEDGASQTYVGAKKTACDEVGYAGDVRRFPASITEEALLEEIDKVQLAWEKNFADISTIKMEQLNEILDEFRNVFTNN